jgi:hypothetical protein
MRIVKKCKEDLPDLLSLYMFIDQSGSVSVLEHCWFRVLSELADQLFKRSVLPFSLRLCMTGGRDSYD